MQFFNEILVLFQFFLFKKITDCRIKKCKCIFKNNVLLSNKIKNGENISKIGTHREFLKIKM